MKDQTVIQYKDIYIVIASDGEDYSVTWQRSKPVQFEEGDVLQV